LELTDWERCKHCGSLKIEDEECEICETYERKSFEDVLRVIFIDE